MKVIPAGDGGDIPSDLLKPFIGGTITITTTALSAMLD